MDRDHGLDRGGEGGHAAPARVPAAGHRAAVLQGRLAGFREGHDRITAQADVARLPGDAQPLAPGLGEPPRGGGPHEQREAVAAPPVAVAAWYTHGLDEGSGEGFGTRHGASPLLSLLKKDYAGCRETSKNDCYEKTRGFLLHTVSPAPLSNPLFVAPPSVAPGRIARTQARTRLLVDRTGRLLIRNQA